VIITLGKPLWRCQTHSLKSISHHNFFSCTRKCDILYFDITASDQTFRLCVAFRKCWVPPAGNTFSNKFSCLFLKKKNQLFYKIPRVLFNCSLYLCNCILGSGHECDYVYTQICFCSANRVQRGEKLWLLSFFNSALYGGTYLDLGNGRFAPKESDQSIIWIKVLEGLQPGWMIK